MKIPRRNIEIVRYPIESKYTRSNIDPTKEEFLAHKM
jgi:hypothetical protein